MWAKRQQPGFTLVELIIVVAVIAILAALAFVSYNGVQRGARDNTVRSDVAGVEAEVARYATKNNGIYGSAVAWYSNAAANPNIQFTPSPDNRIDVVATDSSYCIRAYNIGSAYSTIALAFTKQSAAGVCDILSPSTQAQAESP